MEKNEKKINLTTIFLLLIIVTLIVALVLLLMKNNNLKIELSNSSSQPVAAVSEQNHSNTNTNSTNVSNSIEKASNKISNNVEKAEESSQSIETSNNSSETNNYHSHDFLEKLAITSAKSYFMINMPDGSTLLPTKVTVSKITVYDNDYIELLKHPNEDGVKASDLDNLKSNVDYPYVVGSMEFIFEYEKDITGGFFAGSGPQYSYGNKAVSSRYFVYKNINGTDQFEFNTGV